ncbi:MAG: glycosyl hydrolase family 18 protein [Lachnospiraceae bacterium]
MTIYTVLPGDTIDSIGNFYGISPSFLAFVNQIPPPYSLAVGESLLITETAAPVRPSKIFTGGYAYPFISPWVLSETLPYLSDLFVFSYGFTPSGFLIPPLINDTWMIAAAKAYHTAPILTLTPFGADGQFNNMLISQVVNSPSARTQLVTSLTEEILKRGFEGVDIDFEYVLAKDRIPFADFVAQVQSAVHALGYPVSVALAPKTSDTQTGLLYEGKDYALLGEAADYVLLMTYEWGYTYGPAMAVAPLNKVRQVIEYALTKIPSKKINLGIPNYGYDWTLPFISGTSKAQTIGNVEAVQIAIANHAVILFDELAQSPYFYYQRNEMTHEVWFEDVRSIHAKFKLIEEYGLRGISYWQIMHLFRANWILLSQTFP